MTNRALIAVAIVAVVSVAAFASSRVEAQLPDCVSGGAVRPAMPILSKTARRCSTSWTTFEGVHLSTGPRPRQSGVGQGYVSEGRLSA